jgi:hypothetical protein
MFPWRIDEKRLVDNITFYCLFNVKVYYSMLRLLICQYMFFPEKSAAQNSTKVQGREGTPVLYVNFFLFRI